MQVIPPGIALWAVPDPTLVGEVSQRSIQHEILHFVQNDHARFVIELVDYYRDDRDSILVLYST